MIALELDLLTDVCCSQSNRSLGEPETFRHIPGRTLWGAAVHRAYAAGMAEEEIFRLFFRGAVRILDAVPLGPAGRACPVPMSWHEPKEGPFYVQAFNLAMPQPRDSGTQLKTVAAGWLDPAATLVQVDVATSLRTSVDHSGRARAGLLFGLPVMRAGLRLATLILGSATDTQKVAELLEGEELRLGRSRNAEFGLVLARRVGQPHQGLAPGQGQARGRVSFLCESRLLLRDPANGAATLIPQAAHFQLEPSAWELDRERCFVRAARITNYNSTRKRPESERFALERGSVVTFKSSGSVDLGELGRRLEQGVGELTGQGYGRVVVAPSWLTETSVAIRKPAPAGPCYAEPPQDDLFRWAQENARQRGEALKVYRDAQQQAVSLRKYGVPPSQWGALHRMAREARLRGLDSQALRSRLERFVTGLSPDTPPPKDKEKLKPSGKRNLSRAWKRVWREELDAVCRDRRDLGLYLEHLAGACMRPDPQAEEEQP